MRLFSALAMCAAAASLAVTGTFARAQQAAVEREILSSENGALLPPEHWECGLYVAEYEAFLDAGNDPDSWRFAGRAYRSAGNGDRYDWRGWLDWYEDADCTDPAAAARLGDTAGRSGSSSGVGGSSSSGNMTMTGIGGGLLAGALAVAAAGGGGGDSSPSRPKSPG